MGTQLVQIGRALRPSPRPPWLKVRLGGGENYHELKKLARTLEHPSYGSSNVWWAERPEEDARVFVLRFDRAVFVTWDAEGGTVTMRRWSPERGFSVVERPYP